MNYVFYLLQVEYHLTLPHVPVISIFLNGNPPPNAQGGGATKLDNSAFLGCYQLNGEAIIRTPAISTLQIRNSSYFNN